MIIKNSESLVNAAQCVVATVFGNGHGLTAEQSLEGCQMAADVLKGELYRTLGPPESCDVCYLRSNCLPTDDPANCQRVRGEQ